MGAEQTHPVSKMTSLSIAALRSFFAEEKKSIERGENHYRSEHIESFTYHQGVLRGEVHASMKKKVCKVTVSLELLREVVSNFQESGDRSKNSTLFLFAPKRPFW